MYYTTVEKNEGQYEAFTTAAYVGFIRDAITDERMHHVSGNSAESCEHWINDWLSTHGFTSEEIAKHTQHLSLIHI